MATYSNMKKGVQGEAVSELQRLLNQNGYSLNADGIFGSQTQAAVRDYQQKNGLTVDGIVGNQTWSSLFGSSGNTGGGSSGGNSTADWLADYEGNRPAYQQSQALLDAANMLSQYEGNKPGAYQSSYAAQIQSVLDGIMNREKFSYDFASDPMYQQYADRYQQQGKLAMMDTMGQAAALTGGYGNSYAQSVGQQTYQAHLQGINDIIPELRNAAYQMYRDEGDQMYNQMGMLQGLEGAEYGRYRDTVSDYYSDLNYYYNKYSDMSESEYNRYLNDLSAWQTDRAYYYGKQQDEQSQSNWQAEFDFAKQQAATKASSGGSGGSGGASKNSAPGIDYGSDYNNVLSQVRAMLAKSGTDAALAYLDRMASGGYITDAGADRILYMELGLDDSVFGYGGSNSGTGGKTPTTYKEYIDATGDFSILTGAKFARDKSAGASHLAKYSSYQEYLAEMYQKRK